MCAGALPSGLGILAKKLRTPSPRSGKRSETATPGSVKPPASRCRASSRHGSASRPKAGRRGDNEILRREDPRPDYVRHAPNLLLWSAVARHRFGSPDVRPAKAVSSHRTPKEGTTGEGK